MIRFRTIEPKPAANTNKPTIAPTAAPSPSTPAVGAAKATPQRPEDREKPVGRPLRANPESD